MGHNSVGCCESCFNRSACSEACDYEWHDDNCEEADECPVDGCNNFEKL